MLQQYVGTNNLAGLLKENQINITYSKHTNRKKHVMQLFTKK